MFYDVLTNQSILFELFEYIVTFFWHYLVELLLTEKPEMIVPNQTSLNKCLESTFVWMTTR